MGFSGFIIILPALKILPYSEPYDKNQFGVLSDSFKSFIPVNDIKSVST